MMCNLYTSLSNSYLQQYIPYDIRYTKIFCIYYVISLHRYFVPEQELTFHDRQQR